MTTKNSPLRMLKAQADQIAGKLKAIERDAPAEKSSIKVGIVMDDKTITIEMSLATIRSTSTAGIAEYILNQMREAHDAVN